ncbi:MAG: hypothetical protein J7M26_01130 [Armatimonadetes bacterium]|nr:hypothetical protein [Armatimonadota bacterium]
MKSLRLIVRLVPAVIFVGLGGLGPGIASAQTLNFSDDFSTYAEGSEPSGRWLADGFLWQVEKGAVRALCPGTTHLRLRKPQWFKQVHIEAVVSLKRPATANWKIAGVALIHDEEHFWHAALIESPDASGRAKHFELGMRLPGRWPCQDGLTTLVHRNTDVEWQYNHPYRIVLDLGGGQMRAKLQELDGTTLSEIAYSLSPPAVMDGSPALRCGGFEAVFDDVVVKASEYAGAPEPAAARAQQVPAIDVPSLRQVKGHKTGFFHVEQIDGKWWIIEPRGHGFFALGTDHCRYTGHWCQALGYPPYGKNTQRLYGSEEKWAEVALDRLKRWNFNLLSAGHSPSLRYKGLAHTEFLSLGSGYAGFDALVPKTTWTGFPNVFSKQWEIWCDKVAQQRCAPNAEDPWLMGYFLDNELEWWGKGGGAVGLALEAMKLPADNPAKQALLTLLRDKYHSIARLNKAWGAEYQSWDELAQAEKLQASRPEALRKDQLAYVALAADRYFRVACEAVRRWDPNHMILGCRFAGDAPPGVWEAAGRYCDIVTFNFYGRVDLLKREAPGTAERWTSYYEKARRPLMITEWSFPALDSGLPCKHGAGMRVDTQQQKSVCYEVYQRLVFGLPFMVGSDYFMWVDEPALGISETFPEDSNYGLVNEQDEPYKVLTQTARRVNALAYELHSGRAPEIEVRKIEERGRIIGAVVANTGQRRARFKLAFLVDGKEVERAPVALNPGEEKHVPMTLVVARPAYVTVVADPDRSLAEKDEQNNVAAALIYSPAPWPPCPRGQWLRRWPVLVTTGPVLRPAGAAVSFAADWLKKLGPAEELGRRLAAYDARGRRLACQLEPWPEGWQVAVSLPGAPARSGQMVYLCLGDQDLPAEPPAVRVSVQGNRWQADNGVVRLEGREQGNVVDVLLWRGTPMGRLNPLVWERRAGQDLWTQTVKTARVLAFSGPVRAAVQVWCRSEPEQPSITAVDAEGKMAPQRAQPHYFEVVHRVTLLPGESGFTDRFVALRNLGKDDLELRGWFYYLLSAIGGDQAGDTVGGPDVPNYWLNLGAWKDDKLGLTLGAVPAPDKRISTYFWQDPGGAQHADMRRNFPGPVIVRPGQEWREQKPAPAAVVFAGRLDQAPWAQVSPRAFAMSYGDVRVMRPERP